ncbi:MAG: ferrous iron transporter B [Spirochaetes bacterium]|nr:ferrous iron transporter B [Spirochaetota bacterium]
MKRIVLMGNPNVGKSVIFSRLTGVNVIASNYTGTTVEYTKGYIRKENEKSELIDAPGTYSLKATNRAEEVAVKIFHSSDLVINVLDATNLERNLNLTLQLLKSGKPVIVVLNFWDEVKHIGISINVDRLEKIIGVPVVTTCALTGEGIKNLFSRIDQAKARSYTFRENQRWSKVGHIIQNVQRISHRHHTVWERVLDLTIKPMTGLPLSILVLILSFAVIRFIGESLITYLFEPFFEKIYGPLILKLSSLLKPGMIHDILIGRLINGRIDFVESLGLLTTGLFVPFAMVLPYIFAFYLILSFLEDSGYLPRLAVLVDNFMHRLGLHGLSIIPMILGLGCNVPGALATRILETKKERFIAATVMAICVPCTAQIAMVMGLVGQYGVKGIGVVFFTLFIVGFVLGVIMNKLIKGESPEIFLEIPPYRIPYWKGLLKKLWMRIKGFLSEAVPYVIVGVFIINMLYVLGVISFLGKLSEPVIKGVLGLPKESVGALVIGFLRKDVAVGMLAPLGMSLKQLVIASVILTMYFPCVATFTVLVKELGILDMAKATAVMILSTLIVGGILNLIL